MMSLPLIAAMLLAVSLGAWGETSLDAAWRALAMYVAGLVIVRLGKERLLGRTTAFDIILGIILGSLFSRAINGTASVSGTVVAGTLLVGVHALIGMISYRWPRLDHLLKGSTATWYSTDSCRSRR